MKLLRWRSKEIYLNSVFFNLVATLIGDIINWKILSANGVGGAEDFSKSDGILAFNSIRI